MPSSLAPAFLLSMPQLQDPNFNRTVVLLCEHNESGAFGLVVNRPSPTHARVVMELDPPVSADLPVWIGGPVEPHRTWMLVGEEIDEPVRPYDVRIAERLYLSTSPARVRHLFEPVPPPRMRLVVGYSGWAPGQLEAELNASAWLVGEADVDLVFDTPAAEMWEAAIRRLGADPATLQISRGVH
jgi:putative transcriptional regulator